MIEEKLIRIEVTQDDIEQGIPCDPLACPVALAVARHFGKPDAKVYGTHLYIGAKHFEFASDLPKKFISDFDNERPVQPIAFHLVKEPD